MNLQKTTENKIEITKEVVETVDLIQLDTEIAHLKDVISQTQLELDSKQSLRDSITETFPGLEAVVYPVDIKPVEM